VQGACNGHSPENESGSETGSVYELWEEATVTCHLVPSSRHLEALEGATYLFEDRREGAVGACWNGHRLCEDLLGLAEAAFLDHHCS